MTSAHAIEAVNVSYRVNRRVSGAARGNQLQQGRTRFAPRTAKRPNIATSASPCKICRPTRSGTSSTIRSAGSSKTSCSRSAVTRKGLRRPGQRPLSHHRDGRRVFIHKARIRKPVSVVALGKPAAPRYAAPGSNHHMEIFAVVGSDGKEKRWDSEIVSLFEAHRRVRAGAAGHPARTRRGTRTFKFSLAGGEYVEMDDDSGETVAALA